jgi:MFS family permease
LYESYGFSVATLYAIGFAFGAITTPITGPLIDKFGRKKSALLYCILEIGINLLEQYPFFAGLVVSRIVGGVTTNLLSSVFETWLDTEYRFRGFDNEKYEIIMRDSVVVSNVAAIASGYLAHVLAERLGPVGPFQGAVACTALALVVIFFLWNENYGGKAVSPDEDDEETSKQEPEKSMFAYGQDAFNAFRNDSRVLRVGIIQGLTVGSLQTFIFLWSPTLQTFAKSALSSSMGLDSAGEPAYGLIFGAFMAAGVTGGLLSPFLRKITTSLLSPLAKKANLEEITVDGEEVRPMAVEFLACGCYLLASMLLLVPCVMDASDASSFSISLGAFLVYELLVGVMMPCEGVIRSLYLPSDARASMMTLPRIIVNLAVALGVIITRSIT